ncbi:DMT family transporter [Aedoeadaptatus coli]|uniref:DMT family transporter n=1 Tax=Aedoeadaptatus coli TaxID=2058292 RepID=UPI000D5622CD|nr:DMT family transporter [Peptoniphilus coli]
MLKGMLLIFLSTFMWALNGNVGAYIFQYKGFTPDVLVAVRLIIVGIVLFINDLYHSGRYAFRVVRKRENIPAFLLYSIGGILCMQYGYFTAISYSNAPTTTLIQYTGMFFVIFVVAIKERTWPKPIVYPTLALCSLGLFLMVTGGDPSNLKVNSQAIIWGLISAVGFMNFNLAPTGLSKTYRSMEIIGPSMLLGGIVLTLLTRPDFTAPTWDATATLCVLYTIIGGTLIPFWTFLEGARYTGAQKSSIFALSEAVFSTIVAMVLYHLTFKTTDLVGMLMIFGSVLLLSLPEKKKPKKQKPLRERVREED